MIGDHLVLEGVRLKILVEKLGGIHFWAVWRKVVNLYFMFPFRQPPSNGICMMCAMVVDYQKDFSFRSTDHATQEMLEGFLGEILLEGHESHSAHIRQHRYHVATKTTG